MKKQYIVVYKLNYYAPWRVYGPAKWWQCRLFGWWHVNGTEWGIGQILPATQTVVVGGKVLWQGTADASFVNGPHKSLLWETGSWHDAPGTQVK